MRPNQNGGRRYFKANGEGGLYMRKRKALAFTLAAALLLALLAAGCTTAAVSSGKDAGGPQAAASAEPAAKPGDEQSGATLPVIDTGNAAASGKKVVYTADMTIEAKDAAAAIDDISSTAVSLGGYVSGSQFMEESKNASSWITVRIAPAKFNEFTAHVGKLGKVLSQALSSQDVTDQYYDVQARLANAQAQEAQLLGIMLKAEKIDDILKVREQLDSVQQEIEQYKGQIRLMDSQVGFATVTVTIQEPPVPAVVVEESNDAGVKFWGFAAVWQKISNGFVSGFNWTLNAISVILMILAYVVLPLVLLGAVALGVYFIVKAARRRKKK
jgi:hypothetical protein